ncbi:HNH endonuclease signature motif containing protein [Demequina iriomotensis]|uniref:HNH endonuclease signature motif containing protein n=1 Tax=Demequina iriomotensis TaxID=1536641 RepID=UPI00078328B2|nr:HNH endonuclease signature motif containing protein [Demequina iriomotensis]
MEISEAVAVVTRALDALVPATPDALATLSEGEVTARTTVLAQIRRQVDLRGAVLAGEVARRSDTSGGGMARRHGHRNAVAMVADAHGGTTREARDLITAGAVLTDTGVADGSAPAPRWPMLAAALRAGEVSTAKAALVKDTLDVMCGAGTDVEARLVGKARALSLADLTKVCTDVKARWDIGQLEAREKRQRGERYLSMTEGVDGMITLHATMDPASAAPIKTFLDAQVRRTFATRRNDGAGPMPAGEAGRIRLDSLVDLARHGLRCNHAGTSVSTTLVVHLDEEALRTGIGLGRCDAITTPLTAATARRLAVDAQIIPLVLGSRSQPLDLGYATRFFTPAQRIALAIRDGGCAFCHAPTSFCDAHHIIPASQGGPSDLANGVLLCTRCHHRIHDDGWTIHATPTEVGFTPPATIDPQQRPRQGGKATLHIDLPPRAPIADAAATVPPF